MSTATVHTMRYYRQKEAIVFSTIPGMEEFFHADRDALPDLEVKHPDAAFALMIADNLSTGDREQNMIHQRAYFSILNGEDISTVRFRYDRDMDAYVQRHMWDD